MKLFKYKDYMYQFINESNEDIDYICKKYGIKNYTINDDGTVDVDGYVDIHNRDLSNIPLKFGKVTGDFICNSNILTSLEGCPKEVGGDFHCSSNRLTSLEGGPKKVGGNFFCSYNKLRDFKGFPKFIDGVYGFLQNPVFHIFHIFPLDSFKEVPELLNEYNVIRDGNKIVMQALELVYDDLGIEVPENIEVEGYEII